MHNCLFGNMPAQSSWSVNDQSILNSSFLFVIDMIHFPPGTYLPGVNFCCIYLLFLFTFYFFFFFYFLRPNIVLYCMYLLKYFTMHFNQFLLLNSYFLNK